MSYEEDLQLPESGSLVQCISVDPHSAVFGPNGLRLDSASQQTLEKQGSVPPPPPPDVTGDHLKYGRGSTSFLSSFRTPALKVETTTTTASASANTASNSSAFWAKGKSKDFLCIIVVHDASIVGTVGTSASPPLPLSATATVASKEQQAKQPTFTISSSSSLHDENMIMAPPALFSGQFTSGELPELDECGYASLVLRTAKNNPSAEEPVYERIKGERPVSQE